MQDPQSLHKYAYVHGDPIRGVDPTGMFFGVGGISFGFGFGASTLTTQVGAGGAAGGATAPILLPKTTTKTIQTAKTRLNAGGPKYVAHNFNLWWNSMLHGRTRAVSNKARCLGKGCIGVASTMAGKWPVDMLDTSTTNANGGSTLVSYSYDSGNSPKKS